MSSRIFDDKKWLQIFWIVNRNLQIEKKIFILVNFVTKNKNEKLLELFKNNIQNKTIEIQKKIVFLNTI